MRNFCVRRLSRRSRECLCFGFGMITPSHSLDSRRSPYDADGPPVLRFMLWTTRNVGIGGSAAH